MEELILLSLCIRHIAILLPYRKAFWRYSSASTDGGGGNDMVNIKIQHPGHFLSTVFLVRRSIFRTT